MGEDRARRVTEKFGEAAEAAKKAAGKKVAEAAEKAAGVMRGAYAFSEIDCEDAVGLRIECAWSGQKPFVEGAGGTCATSAARSLVTGECLKLCHFLLF